VEEPSQEAGEAGRRINRAWTSSDLCRRIRGLQAVPEGGVLGAFEPVVGGSEWRRQLSAYTGEVAGCVLGNVLGVLGSQRYPRTPCASRARAVQDPASELPRIHLLRTPVHRGTATTVSSKCMQPWGGRTAEFFDAHLSLHSWMAPETHSSMLRSHCHIWGVSGSNFSMKPTMKRRSSIRASLLTSSSKKSSVWSPPIGTKGT
jgi:hypothetical protein